MTPQTQDTDRQEIGCRVDLAKLTFRRLAVFKKKSPISPIKTKKRQCRNIAFFCSTDHDIPILLQPDQ